MCVCVSNVYLHGVDKSQRPGMQSKTTGPHVSASSAADMPIAQVLQWVTTEMASCPAHCTAAAAGTAGMWGSPRQAVGKPSAALLVQAGASRVYQSCS